MCRLLFRGILSGKSFVERMLSVCIYRVTLEDVYHYVPNHWFLIEARVRHMIAVSTIKAVSTSYLAEAKTGPKNFEYSSDVKNM